MMYKVRLKRIEGGFVNVEAENDQDAKDEVMRRLYDWRDPLYMLDGHISNWIIDEDEDESNTAYKE